MTPLFPVPTWFVGCGNMAGAMIDGWRSANVDLSGGVVIRPSGKPIAGVRTVTSLAEAGNPPAMVLLGIKPQKLDEVAPDLARWVTSKTVVVSILAGVEVSSLRDRFRNAKAIVRAMPNLPVAVRRGVIALYSGDADEALRSRLSQLFQVLGFVSWTANEEEFEGIGELSGAGPAYVARFIDALAKAGAGRGLDQGIARTVALETVLGTAWMAAATQETMDAVARRVASPKGTTEAGLAVLDRDEGLDRLVSVTIEAAARRNAELAEEAKGKSLA
jgi:pyrroline-5-carboxylate reductase